VASSKDHLLSDMVEPEELCSESRSIYSKAEGILIASNGGSRNTLSLGLFAILRIHDLIPATAQCDP